MGTKMNLDIDSSTHPISTNDYLKKKFVLESYKYPTSKIFL